MNPSIWRAQLVHSNLNRLPSAFPWQGRGLKCSLAVPSLDAALLKHTILLFLTYTLVINYMLTRSISSRVWHSHNIWTASEPSAWQCDCWIPCCLLLSAVAVKLHRFPWWRVLSDRTLECAAKQWTEAQKEISKSRSWLPVPPWTEAMKDFLLAPPTVAKGETGVKLQGALWLSTSLRGFKALHWNFLECLFRDWRQNSGWLFIRISLLSINT